MPPLKRGAATKSSQRRGDHSIGTCRFSTCTLHVVLLLVEGVACNIHEYSLTYYLYSFDASRLCGCQIHAIRTQHVADMIVVPW